MPEQDMLVVSHHLMLNQGAAQQSLLGYFPESSVQRGFVRF